MSFDRATVKCAKGGSMRTDDGSKHLTGEGDGQQETCVIIIKTSSKVVLVPVLTNNRCNVSLASLARWTTFLGCLASE